MSNAGSSKEETPVKEQKMYKIMKNNRRYNSVTFTSYEAARKYVRRLVTKLFGSYKDAYTQFGFKVGLS